MTAEMVAIYTFGAFFLAAYDGVAASKMNAPLSAGMLACWVLWPLTIAHRAGWIIGMRWRKSHDGR